MSCDCLAKYTDEDSKVLKMAERLAMAEQTDYVIYKYEGKKYFDRKECWQKAGSPGESITLICYI